MIKLYPHHKTSPNFKNPYGRKGKKVMSNVEN